MTKARGRLTALSGTVLMTVILSAAVPVNGFASAASRATHRETHRGSLTRATTAPFSRINRLSRASQAAPSTATTPADEAVAYQIGSGHSGSQASDSLTPPLTRKWSANIMGASYPVIAQGKVFVVDAGLKALDLATGATIWGPVNFPNVSWVTYDAGKVFTGGSAAGASGGLPVGKVAAYDPATGAVLWQTTITSQYAFSSPPTAGDGFVYFEGSGSGGTLYALSQADGTVKWTQSIENGDTSAPAVSTSAVYDSAVCHHDDAWDATTGSSIWQYSGNCFGGGGLTPVVYGGRLYSRDYASDMLVLDAATGVKLTSFKAPQGPPAFSGTMGYFSMGNSVIARNLGDGSTAWTFTGSGSDTFAGAPVTANGYMYVSTQFGHLYALNATTGAPVWDDQLGSMIAGTFFGIAVGEGTLVVPTSNGLLAYTGTTPTLPSAPTNVVAGSDIRGVDLSWGPPVSAGATPITGYSIAAFPSGPTLQVGAGTTSTFFGGLTAGTTYSFIVRAMNSAGTGPPSDLTDPARAFLAFYFAEGFTGGGFDETVSLFMPNHDGRAYIDFYTKTSHFIAFGDLKAGQVDVIDVNQTLATVFNQPPGQEVSMRVALPYQGVAERVMYFNLGSWHGTTDNVGVTSPATEWDFAEGSTIPQFSEYLTLQNPNDTQATVDLNYMTDVPGVHPAKTLVLPPTSRTTVPVFVGDPSPSANCAALVNCGIGSSFVGVSVQVRSHIIPIVAERPFYVNGFSFGSGPIHDGHDAFGANQPGRTWSFAEGNTLPGWNEYLTLQNPNGAPATVTLNYFTDSGATPTKQLTLAPTSRTTIPVRLGDQTGSLAAPTACIAATNCGVGPGILGVSVTVNSDAAIVAERPMYMVQDFGTGKVAGAHDAVGATSLSKLFGYAEASTVPDDNYYLTIQNSSPTDTAAIHISYYATDVNGITAKIQRSFSVPPKTRHTLLTAVVVNPTDGQSDGLGPGYYPIGIVIESTIPILVEKPTYSSYPSTYGATDTQGYSPDSF